MTRIVFDTEKIGVWIAPIFGVIIIVCILFILLFTVNLSNSTTNTQIELHNIKNQIEESKVTPTPTTTPQTTVISFTALSSTISNGQYQVLTTDGRILIFRDYYNWDQIYPHGVYIADATQNNGIYYVTSTNEVGLRQRENTYYYNEYKYNYRSYNGYQEYTPNGQKCIFDHCG